MLTPRLIIRKGIELPIMSVMPGGEQKRKIEKGECSGGQHDDVDDPARYSLGLVVLGTSAVHGRTVRGTNLTAGGPRPCRVAPCCLEEPSDRTLSARQNAYRVTSLVGAESSGPAIEAP